MATYTLTATALATAKPASTTPVFNITHLFTAVALAAASPVLGTPAIVIPYPDFALSSVVTDSGMSQFAACNVIHLCSDHPLSYADTLTKSLGSKSGVSFGAIQASAGNERKVSSGLVIAGGVTTNGLATRWAAVDSNTSRLLATGIIAAPMALTIGNVWTLQPIVVHMPNSPISNRVTLLAAQIVGSAAAVNSTAIHQKHVLVPTVLAGAAPVLGNPAFAQGGGGPTGQMQTLSNQCTVVGDWWNCEYYQGVNSPWWLINNDFGGPVANSQWITYYPNNFPDYTTIHLNHTQGGQTLWGYPSVSMGRHGRTGANVPQPGHTLNPPWQGMRTSQFSRFIVSWDYTVSGIPFSQAGWPNSGNFAYDVLFENFVDDAYETAVITEIDPNHVSWYHDTSGGVIPFNLGGLDGYCTMGFFDGALIYPKSVVTTGVPVRSGSFDWVPIWAWLRTNHGFVDGTVNGWEFGIECYGDGVGTITFNHVNVDAA